VRRPHSTYVSPLLACLSAVIAIGDDEGRRKKGSKQCIFLSSSFLTVVCVVLCCLWFIGCGAPKLN
jgi:hypothetical protein